MDVVLPLDEDNDGLVDLVLGASENGWLDDRKDEAIAAVPDEYVDLATLAGDPGYVRERIGVYREIGVTYLNINVIAEEPLKVFEQVKAWVD